MPCWHVRTAAQVVSTPLLAPACPAVLQRLVHTGLVPAMYRYQVRLRFCIVAGNCCSSWDRLPARTQPRRHGMEGVPWHRRLPRPFSCRRRWLSF